MRRAWPALCLLAACARAEVPTEAGAPDADAPSHTVTLELHDAPVEQVLEAASRAAEQSVVIDPDAQVLARCARVTVLTGKPVAGDELFALLAEAMRPAALDLVKASNGGWILRRNAGAPPPSSCEANAPPIAGSPQSSASLPPVRAADPTITARIIAGIKRISDTEFEVKESARDLFLQHGGATNARIVPEMRDGATVGLRVFGVRASDPLAAIGIKNGDTVTSVNGLAISSPDQALEAYSKLRGATRIQIQVERQGKPMEIVVRIVPDAPAGKAK